MAGRSSPYPVIDKQAQFGGVNDVGKGRGKGSSSNTIPEEEMTLAQFCGIDVTGNEGMKGNKGEKGSGKGRDITDLVKGKGMSSAEKTEWREFLLAHGYQNIKCNKYGVWQAQWTADGEGGSFDNDNGTVNAVAMLQRWNERHGGR